MIATGFLPAPERLIHGDPVATATSAIGGVGMLCPKCGQPGVVKEGACLTCRSCGWSKCA